MSEEDKKLLLEMKSNCLEDRGSSRITYNDEKRIKKAKAIDNALKEIERLNNIIEEYKNANEYHQNIIHELETMKQPNQLHSENVKLRAENNRLNNIINELEKTLLEWHEYWEDDDSYSWQYKNAYDYLQELKGSDKE